MWSFDYVPSILPSDEEKAEIQHKIDVFFGGDVKAFIKSLMDDIDKEIERCQQIRRGDNESIK